MFNRGSFNEFRYNAYPRTLRTPSGGGGSLSALGGQPPRIYKREIKFQINFIGKASWTYKKTRTFIGFIKIIQFSLVEFQGFIKKTIGRIYGFVGFRKTVEASLLKVKGSVKNIITKDLLISAKKKFEINNLFSIIGYKRNNFEISKSIVGSNKIDYKVERDFKGISKNQISTLKIMKGTKKLSYEKSKVMKGERNIITPLIITDLL